MQPSIPPGSNVDRPGSVARCKMEGETEQLCADNTNLGKLAAIEQILARAERPMLTTDARGKITEANHSACQLFGYDAAEMLGMPVCLLLAPMVRAAQGKLLERFIDSECGRRPSMPFAGCRKDGTCFPFEAGIAKFRNGDDWTLLVAMDGIDPDCGPEQAYPASHDALTGLPNRALLREKISNALQRSRRNGLNVALLFIDLDGFKLINNSHGLDAGDSLLKAVAIRLGEQVRLGETVGRLAGDEFVVLCEQVAQAATMSVVAERIVGALRRPFETGGVALAVTASVGVAIGNGSTHCADDLLRHADMASHTAKEKGRNGWQFFSSEVQQQAAQRMHIADGLRGAIERDEFSPRFQPIVVADSGRIVGAELLLRWNPSEGAVSPAVFIPVAEETGAIVAIGAWVFRQACRAEADWRGRWGESAPYVSVNVSTRQLNEESLADDFAATLRQTGADPARLLLEITETSLMTDVEKNLRILRRLADLGLRVAVDDFGTGYSSLAQLTRLPVDVLKIDKAFIDDIDKNPESRAVIRAVIGLGRALGLKLVAEGVENGAQQLELCALGCDLIQGYHFHRPLEENVFVETVEREMRTGAPGAAAPLHYLIYVSQAVQAMAASELAGLLQGAREFNRSQGVTGCLIYQDGCFLQMLEGRQEPLAALMDKVSKDARHRDVRIVIEGRAKRRVFVDWSMALRDLTHVPDDAEFAKWQGRSISLPELADDARVCYAYITSFMHAGITH